MDFLQIQNENQVEKNENQVEKIDVTTAKKYIEASKAENTKKAYQSDWKHFTSWCSEKNLASLPADPKTVALYISQLADQGYKTSTIQRRLVSISQAHKTAGYDSPTQTTEVRTTFQGIKRILGTAPKQKKAASLEILKAIVESLGESLIDIRNRALLLVGWNGGFRRSELIALNVEDVEFSDEGVTLFIRKSKTDQEGKGRKVAIPFGQYAKTCPVRALQRWINEANLTSGALFRRINRHGQLKERLTGDGVAYIIKQSCKRAGFDDKEFAGHSLRRGFITTAAKKGKSEMSIMRQTGHKSIQTLRRYIEEANIFEDNAAEGLGL